jgi:selenocysteine insertion sequence-binding protein 2
MEDEDCLNESLSDIRTLAEQYGILGSVRAEVSSEQRNVRLSYLEGHQAARQAAQRLDGMLLGGVTVSASAVSPTDHMMNDDDKDIEISASVPPPPMYSGDRIIPEQFAACKRVPKIPNAAPRSYASKIGDERAVTLLSEMLGELMRLQERSKDDKNARARRRVVMGLREVARGIRARKVKMVVMANNLDEYGAIDSKLQEILDLARVGELPVLYELNKRKLGKALGKSIKVSVVGIQNADGAHEQFKKLKKMVGFS